MAKLAVTPPMVGSVRNEMNSWPEACRRPIASEVFTICMREMMPSCILAPPEQEKMISGSFSSSARSASRAIFSPMLWPMELIR